MPAILKFSSLQRINRYQTEALKKITLVVKFRPLPVMNIEKRKEVVELKRGQKAELEKLTIAAGQAQETLENYQKRADRSELYEAMLVKNVQELDNRILKVVKGG